MKPSDRLMQLKRRYDKARRDHRGREGIAQQMQQIVLKQLRKEIREDKRAGS